MIVKRKCELCKCLNLIAELKKHPNKAGWLLLLRKFTLIRTRDTAAIASFCEDHRMPLRLVTEIKSVASFVDEVISKSK